MTFQRRPRTRANLIAVLAQPKDRVVSAVHITSVACIVMKVQMRGKKKQQQKTVSYDPHNSDREY